MNTPLNDSPVWLITGCSSGLGRALAARVLARGHRLIATARQPETLDELVAVDPSRCRALALDVADASQVSPVVAQAAEIFGRLDVVVNNAGYGLVGAVEEYDEAQITRNFETNFFGALRVIRAAPDPIPRACAIFTHGPLPVSASGTHPNKTSPRPTLSPIFSAT